MTAAEIILCLVGLEKLHLLIEVFQFNGTLRLMVQVPEVIMDHESRAASMTDNWTCRLLEQENVADGLGLHWRAQCGSSTVVVHAIFLRYPSHRVGRALLIQG